MSKVVSIFDKKPRDRRRSTQDLVDFAEKELGEHLGQISTAIGLVKQTILKSRKYNDEEKNQLILLLYKELNFLANDVKDNIYG